MSEENNTVKLPEPGSLIVSSSPHLHENSSISKIMLQVLLCLLPAVLAAVWFFGLPALKVMVYCVAFCMLLEYLWCRLMKQKSTLCDFSAAVTGLILALNLPSHSQWWLCAVGSFVAIIIAKQVFGGLGQNPFNPAAVGRVALLIGFTGPMTTQWVAPTPGAFVGAFDAVTTATPLTLAKAGAFQATTSATPLSVAKNCAENVDPLAALQTADSYWNYFIGNMGGSLGETSALAILIGAIGLLAFRLIRWEIPVAVLGTMAIFTWIVHTTSPSTTPGPLFHLLTGGAMIGAFFMATDMVTSPLTRRGCVIFGAGIGIITCVIRIWGGFPEGMSFAIVIMNALVPLIDRFCFKRPFGWTHASGGAK